MNRSILLSGFFSDEDWKELMDTIRKIEQRHPDVEYHCMLSDATHSLEEAADLLEKTFPKTHPDQKIYKGKIVRQNNLNN
jgi:hypothetical protein